jgi:hypothetical protein
VDWDKRELDRYLAFKAADKEARDKNYVPRRENTNFSHAIDEYMGEYSNPAYGTMIIEPGSKPGDLKITYHTMQSTAEHWHYDVWRIPHNRLDLLEETEIMFNTDWGGNITSVFSSMEPAVKDILFTRQPDRQMHERGFLEPLTGTYQIADFKIIVSLRADNTLIATLSNQRVWELEPVRGNTFAVKGENGLTFDFKRDPSGKVAEFSLNQAGSSSVYKKIR